MKKLNLFLLLSLIALNSFSMEHLARLNALPIQGEGDLISFDEIPNPPAPAPPMPLHLWQTPHAKAQLELPLVEAKIKMLEKKHIKEKRAFNKKREMVADHAMYAVGYMMACYGIVKLVKAESPTAQLSIVRHPLDVVLLGMTVHNGGTKFVEKYGIMIVNLFEYGFGISAVLAAKNAAQGLWKSPNLFGAPREPVELIAARTERNRLQLLTQEPAQVPQ